MSDIRLDLKKGALGGIFRITIPATPLNDAQHGGFFYLRRSTYLFKNQ